MARPRKTDRPIAQRIYLPESLVAELSLRLWSESEERVPYGVLSAFVEQAIREALARSPILTQEIPNGSQS
jgi:hypothetical protein